MSGLSCYVRSDKSHAYDAVQDVVTVKFYLDAHAFATERRLYTDPRLRTLIAGAPIFIPNDDGLLRFPDGYVIPPHSISDQCEPLHVWREREEVDQITAVQVR